MLRDHLRTVIIPHLFEVWRVDQQQNKMDNELTVDDFLEKCLDTYMLQIHEISRIHVSRKAKVILC